MGQKVNPISTRLRINREFDSYWFSDFYYSDCRASVQLILINLKKKGRANRFVLRRPPSKQPPVRAGPHEATVVFIRSRYLILVEIRIRVT